MSPTLLSSETAKAITAKKGKKANKKKSRKSPKDRPKRPLSAYNLFFQYERDVMLRNALSPFGHSLSEHCKLHSTLNDSPAVRKNRNKSARPPPHGKIGFAEMAKMIGQKWKSLASDRREHFQSLAAIEKNRYTKEVAEWKRKKDGKEGVAEMTGNEEKPQVSPTQQQQLSLCSLLNQANEMSSQQMPMNTVSATCINEMPAFGAFHVPGIEENPQFSPAHEKHEAMCNILNQASEISSMNEMPVFGGFSGPVDEYRPQLTPFQKKHEAVCNILNQAKEISTQHLSELPQAAASSLATKKNHGFKLALSNFTTHPLVQATSMSAQKDCWGPKFNVPATRSMDSLTCIKSTPDLTASCDLLGTDNKIHDVDFFHFLSELVSE